MLIEARDTAAPTASNLNWSALGDSPGELGPRLLAGLRERGYLRLVGHPLAELSGPMFSQARQLFALPPAVKQSLHIRHSTNFRGYSGPGDEFTAERPDYKETFDLGLEQAEWDRSGPAYRSLLGSNRWPAQLPEFEPLFRAAMAATLRIGQTLLACLLDALGCAAELAALFEPEPFGLMRLLRYPSMRERPGVARGLGAHTDYGLFACVLQSEVGGLRAQSPDGRWRALTPEPEALIVMPGDMLERLTGGDLRATPHAVEGPTGDAPRYSISLFVEPSLDARIAPLVPAVPASGGRGGSPLIYGEHLYRALRRSFPRVAAHEPA